MTTTLAPNFHLQKCPPMPAYIVAAPEPAFGNRYKLPVSAEVHAGGEIESTGISYSDFAFMQTSTRKLACGRRTETPSWAVNRSELARLIVRFWELRAGITKPRDGSLKDRLQYAEYVIQHKKVPRWREVLEKLCFERLATDDPQRRRELEVEIRSVDTLIRTAEQGPSLIAGVIYFYYGVGFPSHEVGSLLGIRSVSVRQLLNRLRKIWRRMQSGSDGTDTCWGARGKAEEAAHYFRDIVRRTATRTSRRT